MKFKILLYSLFFFVLLSNIQAQDSLKVQSDTIPDSQVIIEEEFDDEEEEVESGIVKKKKRTKNDMNFDLGLNNYLENGKFPDSDNKPYTVKPLGSWYMAFSSVNSTKIGGPLYMEWGLGVSWYSFKMQDPQIRIEKGVDNIEFVPDANGYSKYVKSKLGVTHLNIFLVPVINFNEKDDKGFRIGFGGYGGYRIGSKTKFVYEIDKKHKEKAKSNFYLNNLRYGFRVQMGWKGTDIFFNYDLNNLFVEGKGPDLNPFGFGIIF